MSGKKSSSGPTGPTPAQERASAKGYWDNYSKWKADETSRYQSDIQNNAARTRARVGASGATGLAEDSIARFDKGRKASYKSAMAGIESGAHGQSLKTYFDKMKAQRIATINRSRQPKYVGAFNINGPGRIILPGDNPGSNPGSMFNFGATGAYANRVPGMSGIGMYGFNTNRAKEEQAYKQQLQASANRQIANINKQSMDDYFKAEFGAYKDPGTGANEKSATEAAQGRARSAAGGARQGRPEPSASAATASGGSGSVGEGQKPLGLANWFA